MRSRAAQGSPAAKGGWAATGRRLLLVLLPLLAAGLLTGAPPAAAHAALTSSDPAAGSVVDAAPARVGLTFSEGVALSDGSLKVLDPKGGRVDDGEAGQQADRGGRTYAVGLRSGLADGTYTVTYQVVSADSHPVAGAFTFSIGAPSKTTVVVGESAAGGGPLGALYDVTRYLSYGGFILLAGGGAFVLACWPQGAAARPLHRLVVGGWLALTAGTLLQLLLRGAYTTSGAFADVLDLSLMNQVLQTKTGAALVSRLLLLAAAALFISVLFGAYVRRDTPEQAEERRDLGFGLAVGGAVVAAGIAATWAMSEHASAGLQTGIAMPLDVVHLLAVAAWLGGVASVLVCLHRAPELPTSAVRRFSAVAFGSVVVLTATGLYQAWRQIGTWSALTGTEYGRLLMAKSALVAVLVGVGFFSQRRVGRLGSTRGGEGAEVGADDVDADVSRETDADADLSDVSRETEAAADPGDTYADGTSADAPADPVRAAQLARQQQVLAVARERRRRDADPHRASLRRTVLTEAVVAAALLAVATVLTSTEPARTAEGAARGSSVPDRPLTLTLPYDTGGRDGTGRVRLDLDPGATGANTLHVYTRTPDGTPVDLPELKISFTLKAKDLGPLPVTPSRVVTGHLTAKGVQLPAAGNWRVAVTVRTSDIDQITVYKNLKVG